MKENKMINEEFSQEEKNIIEELRLLFNKLVKPDLSNVIYQLELDNAYKETGNIFIAKIATSSITPIDVRNECGKKIFLDLESNNVIINYYSGDRNFCVDYSEDLTILEPKLLVKYFFAAKGMSCADNNFFGKLRTFLEEKKYFIKIPDKKIYHTKCFGHETFRGSNIFIYRQAFIADLTNE